MTILIKDPALSFTPDEWADYINDWADSKGWHDKEKSEGDWAALAHTEISEAFEAYRNGEALIHIDEDGKPQGIAVEYADCLIRILHWFAQHDVGVAQTLILKMEYNEKCPHLHGGKRL